MEARTHIVGAGLAGLSCAVALAAAGREVVVHEAAGHAGGRCRSYEDPHLGRRIDNGNHLLLSGNRAAIAYLTEIGAYRSLVGPATAAIPFVDLADGDRWTVRPNGGLVPWWIFDSRRRVPGSTAADYLRALRFLRFLRPGKSAAVTDLIDPGDPLYRRFWEPLVVAVLNTAPEEAAAELLWPVIRETFGRGEAACRPRIAGQGLSESFVDPAVAFIGGKGGTLRFNERLRALSIDGEQVAGLDFGRPLALEPGDSVVLAVPPSAAAELIPGLRVPDRFRAIVNAHFVLPEADGPPRLVGVVGGLAQWVFVRDSVASVTISAAESVVDRPADEIAERLWPEVSRVLDLEDQPMPPHRIVKERRATFAQTPDQIARRPVTRTVWHNLFMAGDWTDTGLPATIEGAIRSGRSAALHVLGIANT